MIRKDEGGLFMEVALVIGMFVCTALALNFLVNGRRKLSGTFEIINLCLIVATAYLGSCNFSNLTDCRIDL